MLLAGACSSDGDSGDGGGRVPDGLAAAPGSQGGGDGSGSTAGGAFDIDNPTGTAPDPRMTTPTTPGAATCGSTDITASRVLPSVMLLVDGSQSMQELYGDPPAMLDAGLTDGGMIDAGMPAPQISRWQAVRQALVDPVDGVVPRLQGLVRFGLAVYGTAPTCPLPLGTIEPSLDNFAPIQSGLPFLPPGVTTPTGLALDQVVDLLPDPKNNLDATVGPQIIILATDGDPNSCDPPPFLAAVPPTNYAPSIQAALKAQQKNLRMYVVSVGQDAAAQHLQEMANLGAGLGQFDSPGAEVFYPEDPAALAATLETLIGDELSCEVSLEGKGVKQGSECMGTVTLNGNELECNGADGWVLTDPTTITLQGASCESYKNASDAQLRANFPCDLLVE
jgi:hypothetical protein